ncbi:mitochondrial ribosomal protein S25-domain-containing protein [Cyathus striatus]|nr:mitochondrial ribosomal protein S25-domain-containing protein [Cyathus striatus]
MVRRFASQVHKQASRLMLGGILKHEPIWFKAVLDYPPLPLPPKIPSPRTQYDQMMSSPNTSRKRHPQPTRPIPIQYLEDEIRRQFFLDHPFEAFRPRTLVESAKIEDPHHIHGVSWTRLRQRGSNPSSEDAIRFAINLYQHHSISLTEAYAKAVSQFRALRSEHHIATNFAVMEAEHFGGTFGYSEIIRGYVKEKRALNTWKKEEYFDDGAIVSKKRWRAIVDKKDKQWTKGEEYVRLWKEEVRPEYYPALTQPVARSSQLQQSQAAPSMISAF